MLDFHIFIFIVSVILISDLYFEGWEVHCNLLNT